MAKQLMKGNEAIAEGAVRAGCRFFAGYPITPQTEILEYLSWRLPEVGGTFLQCESEIAGISAVYGACACGVRALASSSSPGFSLMQEGISYIASAELPCVIVDVARYGSGLGDIFTGQSDYWQAVKNGGHSDYRCPVYAPSSVQEAADLVKLAFAKAEQYKNPVIVLSDASISQMMEPVEFSEFYEHDQNKFDWALKGTIDGKFNLIASTMYYIENYETYIRNKYDQIEKNEEMWEEVATDDAKVILVAYGISSRIAKEAVTFGRQQGVAIGLIRPISLWPYPRKAFQHLPDVKAYISVEMSALGQMMDDIALACALKADVYGFLTGSVVPDSLDIVTYAKQVLAGTVKEVYTASC